MKQRIQKKIIKKRKPVLIDVIKIMDEIDLMGLINSLSKAGVAVEEEYEHGQKKGSVKLDIWRPKKDTYFIVDDNGKQKGVARKDIWQEDLWGIEEK